MNNGFDGKASNRQGLVVTEAPSFAIASNTTDNLGIDCCATHATAPFRSVKAIRFGSPRPRDVGLQHAQGGLDPLNLAADSGPQTTTTKELTMDEDVTGPHDAEEFPPQHNH